ncbi:DUF302 domain-containing protein [Mucilaginibacter jinjuensis]|uniref:DUF302 domain-containing protein n=1 Tax=Mucilaginibacter jinjuensis TaxID=1176721 RepID=A0ABY7T153_9SPHI|nr:DUF302 domain-containing protein [Mucilaginibacter jinjuensis]WCT09910.1 DUF302 domain-containing protein [Mucilaginibacter jinjuensis]
MKAKGVIVKPIKFAPKDAIKLLEKFFRQNGITIYARIDQQAEAANNGTKINPLVFLLFGNPAKGGQVMVENALAALDLPLKVIAWQDEKLNNYIAFNDINYLASRYSLSNCAAQLIDIGAVILKILK